MADGQNLPGAATEHYRLMQELQLRGVRRARRAWSQIDTRHLSASWREQLPMLTASLSEVQLDATTAAAGVASSALAGRGEYEFPTAFVDPSWFTGVLDDGGDLTAALYMPIITTKRGLAGGMSMRQALGTGRNALDRLAASAIKDASRGVASIDVALRNGIGYTRMLNPPSCARCVVLAGRWYRWNAGFDRHP